MIRVISMWGRLKARENFFRSSKKINILCSLNIMQIFISNDNLHIKRYISERV